MRRGQYQRPPLRVPLHSRADRGCNRIRGRYTSPDRRCVPATGLAVQRYLLRLRLKHNGYGERAAVGNTGSDTIPSGERRKRRVLAVNRHRDGPRSATRGQRPQKNCRENEASVPHRTDYSTPVQISPSGEV